MRRFLAAVLLFAASCTDGDRIIDLDDRTGTVRGTAWVDRNADGVYSQGADAAAAGAVAAVVFDATGDTVARATVGADGAFIIAAVPIGRYRIVAGRGTLGDSIDVVQIDEPVFSLAVNDTISREILFGYPAFNAAGVSALPPGLRVTLDGIALNGWATFGDSTVHVADATGAIRAVRVQQSPVQAGDSVRVNGVTSAGTGGTIVIGDAVLRILSEDTTLPAADSVSTADAASALAGALAFAQARVAGAVVLDTGRVAEGVVLGVDDGSGRLEVLLDAGIQFDGAPYIPGATFSGSGVLVPASSGSWQLKPRSRTEVAITFPAISIAAARARDAGHRVIIAGIALNGWSAFGDSTVHLQDATGFIRSVRVLAAVAAGDSVRLIGTTAVRDGQPVLTTVTPAVLRAGVGIAAPDSMSTAVAASADGGALDAALVTIGATITSAQTLANGDVVLSADDGSGSVEVVLDDAIPFAAAQFQVGARLRATGVLVPTGTGAWQLKPRSTADAAAAFDVRTIAEARATAAGQRIAIAGIALNNWSAFGDSTVHLQDATGFIRGVRVLAAVAAGDSVRLIGTTAVRDGQPVLTTVTPAVLLAGVGVPAPDSVSTAEAASADDGALDAALIRVGGTIVGAQTLPNGDMVVSVNDGSGILEVVLDDAIPFQASQYQTGAVLRATGVLVPTGGGVWQLKPRGTTDAVATFPTATIAEARTLQPGETVYINGIALNAWVTFGDQTVHVADATGVIRVISVPQTSLLAGDSVRILGTAGMRNGQPVLDGSSAAVLLAGVGLPAVDSVTTAVAASAESGARDADQVAVSGVILAISSVGGNTVLSIDDGSGPLDVVLDSDVGFATGGYAVGQSVRVRGLLVPAASGTSWELKPRSTSEIAVTATP